MGKDINGVEHREPWKAYDIDEVNAAIAELKAQLESEKASRYAESVDAGIRERRLKRALVAEDTTILGKTCSSGITRRSRKKASKP